MSDLSPQQAIEQAEKLANKAQKAADAAAAHADALADALAAGGHAASGGAFDPLVLRISVFVLAGFVGWYAVTPVASSLHTLVLSLAAMLGSVVMVAGLIAVGIDVVSPLDDDGIRAKGFGFAALTLASIALFGGILVTRRLASVTRTDGG